MWRTRAVAAFEPRMWTPAAGNPERAEKVFEQLLAQAPPGVERADVLFGSATRAPWLTASPAPALLEAAVAELADDHERSARILGYGC